jgi:outer membrane PBP1 activator LpoA protein
MKTHFLVVLLLVPLIFSLACGKKPITPSGTGTPAQEAPLTDSMHLADRAHRAWEVADYPQSQRLYAALTRDPTLSRQTRSLAWERLALSAVYNHDWNTAQEALGAWARAFPEAMSSWPWNKVKAVLTEKRQGVPEAEDFLMSLLKDTDLPQSTRTQVAEELVRRFNEHDNLAGVLAIYGLQYDLETELLKRQALEAQVTSLVQDKSLELLAEAANATRQESITTFPKNILTGVYDLKRLEKDTTLWPQVWQNLVALRDKGQWAGPFPFDQDLETLLNRLGLPRQHIALVIPLQGPYASIGWRIAQGVGAGQWYLTSQGMDLEVTIINSSVPGWEKEVEKLDATCRVVGGPLRKAAWESVLQHGLDRDRAFFAFMSTVEEEGSRVWRFFGSPRDQVRAMVQSAFASGITRFAILYPKEPYGRAMARHFWEEATAQGGTINGMGSYDPRQPASWGKAVAQLLGTDTRNKDALNPEPDFKGVFLPDTLEHAKLIVPQFFFYNENRLVFLGSQLWEQGTNPDSPLEARYFDLAVYPGGWWKNNPGLGMKELSRILRETGQKEPDFWTALGFDFTRFAAGLGFLGSPLARQTVNETLQSQQSFSWTMAPLAWDEKGVASQDYFVFQPTQSGPLPADPARIIQKRTQREARRQERMAALNATMESPETVNAEDSSQTVSP